MIFMLTQAERVKKSNQKRRITLVDIMGGQCLLCGFNTFPEALEFHHINPEEKSFQLSGSTLSRSLKSQIQEIQKCVLLCANCHRGIHANHLKLPENVRGKQFNEQKAQQYLNDLPSKHYCPICNKEISYGATHCDTCAKELRRHVERPSRENLKKLIRNKSFCEIGRLYGVSDNAIRKWCVNENLPTKKTEINKYSDKDWLLI